MERPEGRGYLGCSVKSREASALGKGGPYPGDGSYSILQAKWEEFDFHSE